MWEYDDDLDDKSERIFSMSSCFLRCGWVAVGVQPLQLMEVEYIVAAHSATEK